MSGEIDGLSNELNTELELLREIFVKELHVENCRDTDELQIRASLTPATGDKWDMKFVFLDLTFTVHKTGYPETTAPGEFRLSKVRGVSEDHQSRILHELCCVAESRLGECILYDLIELVQESLTNNNMPAGNCPICLESFSGYCHFTITECTHYFHMACLNEHLNHTDKTDGDPEFRCPSCRDLLDEDYVEALQRNTEELGLKCNLHKPDKQKYVIDPKIIERQLQYQEIYLRQKANNCFFTGKNSRVLDLRTRPSATRPSAARPDTTGDRGLLVDKKRAPPPVEHPLQQESLIISLSALMSSATPDPPMSKDALGSTGSTSASHVEDWQSEISVSLSHDSVSHDSSALQLEKDDLCYTDDEEEVKGEATVDTNIAANEITREDTDYTSPLVNGDNETHQETEETTEELVKQCPSYEELVVEEGEVSLEKEEPQQPVDLAKEQPQEVVIDNNVKDKGLQESNILKEQDGRDDNSPAEPAVQGDNIMKEQEDNIIKEQEVHEDNIIKEQEVQEDTNLKEHTQEDDLEIVSDIDDEDAERTKPLSPIDNAEVSHKSVSFEEVTNPKTGSHSREIQTQTRRPKRNRNRRRSGSIRSSEFREENNERGGGARGGYHQGNRNHNNQQHTQQHNQQHSQYQNQHHVQQVSTGGVVYRRGGEGGRSRENCRSFHEGMDTVPRQAPRRHSLTVNEANWRGDQEQRQQQQRPHQHPHQQQVGPTQPRFKPPRILRQEALAQAKKLSQALSNQERMHKIPVSLYSSGGPGPLGPPPPHPSAGSNQPFPPALFHGYQMTQIPPHLYQQAVSSYNANGRKKSGVVSTSSGSTLPTPGAPLISPGAPLISTAPPGLARPPHPDRPAGLEARTRAPVKISSGLASDNLPPPLASPSKLSSPGGKLAPSSPNSHKVFDVSSFQQSILRNNTSPRSANK